MEILFVSDDGYALPTAIAAGSVLMHNHGARITVGALELSSESRALVSRAAQVRFVEIDPSWLAPFVLSPRGACGRLFIDRLMDSDRAIYLDGDVLVRGSLAPLYDLNLDGHLFAAAPTEASADLLNSGVLLVDVAQWRHDDVGVELAARYGSVAENDQWAMNRGLRDRWLRIGREWNGKDSACVVAHFAGPRKPWHVGYYPNELGREYVAAARRIGVTLPRQRTARFRELAHRARRAIPRLD